jgi:hypothetical protein
MSIFTTKPSSSRFHLHSNSNCLSVVPCSSTFSPPSSHRIAIHSVSKPPKASPSSHNLWRTTMSKVTPPVTKLSHAVRGMNFASACRHQFRVLEAYRPPRKLSNTVSALSQMNLNSSKCQVTLPTLKKSSTQLIDRRQFLDRSVERDRLRSRGFHTLDRCRPSPETVKTAPRMQGFRSSSPKYAARDSSTIDFFFFPEVPEPPPANPFAKLRVPLLPDNYTPDRSANSPHAVESLDGAVPRPEIHVVASHPDNVLPAAAMSEVVGNDGVDVDIGQLIVGFTSPAAAPKEPGVLKELWGGLVDDIFGPKTTSPKTAV